MITHTKQIVWSIVSRQPVADQLQPTSNQLAINRPPVTKRSPIFRDSCRRWICNRKMQFWSHNGCIGCSCSSVARQSPTGCSTCVTGALGEVPYCFSRSSVKFQGQRAPQNCWFWPKLGRFRTVTPVWIQWWLWNDAQSLMLYWWGALLFFMVIYQISRSLVTKNCWFWPKLGVSGL